MKHGAEANGVGVAERGAVEPSAGLKLAQPEFAERLVRALGTRVRTVFESAAGELELWSKTAIAQLDAQITERQRSFGQRIEAIDRIRAAATGLNERIGEIEASEDVLNLLEIKLHELTSQLIPAVAPVAEPATEFSATDFQSA